MPRRPAIPVTVCARAAMALLVGTMLRPTAGRADEQRALPHRHMVVAASPLAARAGLDALREGGTAVDAVLAAQMVLALVEPQASGLAGGALLLHYEASSGAVTAWDGRETAPAAAGPDLFLDRDRKPLAYREAGIGGRAVGVPGVLRMLEAVHRAHGRLPWSRLVLPAAQLAEAGVARPPRLAAAIEEEMAALARQRDARALFLETRPRPGETAPFVNSALAETLRQVAASGADAVMTGPVAAEIATAVRTDPNSGLLTADDLAAYQPRRREPLCGMYRERRICGFGPPSAGGITVLQTLAMLSQFDLSAAEPNGDGWPLATARLVIDAERLANADRMLYEADLDRVPVPLAGLIDPDYLARRARLLDPDRALVEAPAGLPDWGEAPGSALAPSLPQPEHGTSQIVAIDDAGDAVSMTTTVQDNFGARLVVRGMVLNDELTDFAFVPERNGIPVANRVGPGKRPRSAMSPTMVFDAAGRLEIVLGSAGGGPIISYVTQALIEMIDRDRTSQQAVAAPHVAVIDPGGAELEAGTAAASLAPGLAAAGEVTRLVRLDSGSAAIRVTERGLLGGADPRRDGVALGD